MESKNTWLLQIYRMTDATAQTITAGLLAGVDTLTVESVTDEPHCYVIVESMDALQAAAVRNFISSVDPGAMLAHTSNPSARSETAA